MLDELRTNVRLRVGIALALALVVVSLLLDAQSALRDERLRVAREEARLQDLQARASETVWIERASAAAKARRELDARLWSAPAVGVAEAAIVDWMNRELADLRVGQPNVAAVAAVPERTIAGDGQRTLPENVLPLRLNVAFEFAPGAIEKVLDRFEASGRFLVVDSLSVRRQPVPRVEMVVVSAARIAPAGEAANAPVGKAEGQR